MTAHTPGPWGVLPPDDDPVPRWPEWAVFSDAQPPGSQVVATVRRMPGGIDEANARLIAAAPELLAALRKVTAEAQDYHESTGHDATGNCDGICELLPEMRAAIAKAEGRS